MALPKPPGAASSSGSSSVFTRAPSERYANAMLWETNRRAPAARAASSRFRVPSVRHRLVAA